MKTKLFFLGILLISGITFAQSLPTDYVAKYDFTNGDLTNLASPGTGDLTGASIPNSLLRMDRFEVPNNAIRVNANTLNGFAYTSANNRNDISISFWVQGSASSSGVQRVFRLQNSSDTDRISVDIRPNNQLYVFFENTGTQVAGAVSIPNFFDGSWHHLVITTKKGSTGYNNKVYIDGQLNTSLSNDISLSGNTDNFLNAGARFVISPITGSGAYYNNIDDVQLYQRELTAQEILAIYSYTPTPQILYVNHNATGNNDGTSWANAYTDLQSALAVSNGSNQIWVAKGTYKPHPSNRDASFVINCNFYGGFAGTETQLSDRDLASIHTTNKTILSGDLAGNDSNTPSFNDSTRSDNSKHVVEVIVNGIEVNGFTIQDGYADATTGDDRFGAGIFKQISVRELTVKNCIIKNNVAFLGAGLALTTTSQNSNMTVDACIIDNNLANVASGIDYHTSATNANMNITVTNTLFKNNKTDDDASKSREGTGASAMRLRAHFSNVELNSKIVNNTFVNNINNGSGNSEFPVLGMYKSQGSFGIVHIANNIFYGNTRNTTVTRAIGSSSNAGSRITVDISNNRYIAHNTDEDGMSSIPGTIATTTANPNLDANFKPTASSNAVDTGDNGYLPATITTDLDGNTRIYNITVDRGAYEYGGATAGVEDINKFDFTMYPNPANGTLNLQLELLISKVELYNILGKKLKEFSSKKLDVANLPSGIYLVKITTENGKIGVKRFIKN